MDLENWKQREKNNRICRSDALQMLETVLPLAYYIVIYSETPRISFVKRLLKH